MDRRFPSANGSTRPTASASPSNRFRWGQATGSSEDKCEDAYEAFRECVENSLEKQKTRNDLPGTVVHRPPLFRKTASVAASVGGRLLLEATVDDLGEASVLRVTSFFGERNPSFLAVAAHREHRRLREHHGGDRHIQLIARSPAGDAVGYVDCDGRPSKSPGRPRPYVSDLAVREDYRSARPGDVRRARSASLSLARGATTASF